MNPSKAVPRAIAIVVILLGLTACIWWLFFVAPIKAGSDIANAIKEALNFNGRITVNDTVVYEADRDITELAIKEKTYNYTYQWEHKWLGSTKQIQLQGRFKGKAGYDYTGEVKDPKNPWGIDIVQNGQVSARMPMPSVLSVEMLEYKIVEDNDGFWNQISKEDREKAVNQLQSGAKKRFAESGVLAEVDETFIQQIEDALLGIKESKVEIVRDPLP